jgi:hypothetical protein
MAQAGDRAIQNKLLSNVSINPAAKSAAKIISA